MKLIIQIPCFDEAEYLPMTLAALPRTVDGFDVVEYLVVDDGSSDGTADVALRHGAHHIVRHAHNRGLAAAYMTGIAACLARGADVIVGTDGDNQYVGSDIPAVLAPVRDGRADFAMGVRPLHDRRYFPFWKFVLTTIGTSLARALSGLPVLDAPSGLRAYTAATARGLRVTGRFSYTMETLVLAGCRKWRLASVPIRVNPVERPSRLMASVPQYIRKSTFALMRGVTLYRPALMIGLIAFAGMAAALVAIVASAVFGWNGAPLPLGLAAAVAVCGIAGTWMWRVRRMAGVREESVTDAARSLHAVVRSEPNRGNDFASIAGNQEEPLADVCPVARIGVPLAMPAGE